ncbi:glycosyltransferase family 2 protein [Planococcus versutus]|uniref:Glycosyl transferase family 2 n=1 Tax=Planococcus versutus TaxID=1302659 RepID=A0A1B1S4M5_9BACL|nr:glycosyltransferase [Planococcus versutus]ANU28150.1 glycosyl transferase family 2 [Planococcus versutus]
MNKDILVSIDCLAYNHEAYITQAIEGFLMQKTNFSVEILIHDDASTDGTVNIIKHYEKRFPELIKPLYQIENQFSQGVKMQQNNQQRAKGKYIAVCEGDDFWLDPYKLQKQIDFLEGNEKYSLCVHGAYKFSEAYGKTIGKVRPSRKNRAFSAEESIEGGGELFPTNSMVYRRKLADDVPSFYFDAGIGDYPLTIHLAHKGRVYYIDKAMSIYRVDVKGAWSQQTIATAEKAVEQDKKTAELLDQINIHTNFQYDSSIQLTKKKQHFYLLLRQHRLKKAFRKEYIKVYLHKEFVRRVLKKMVNTQIYAKEKIIYFFEKSK